MLAHSYARWDAEAYKAYLERFELPRDKKFKDFSRGMKMKLAIAAALSHGSKLLVLDEPTSGLDPVVRDTMLDLFFEFTREEDHFDLISSHIVSDLEKLCDYVAFFAQGDAATERGERPAAGALWAVSLHAGGAGRAAAGRAEGKARGQLWRRGAGRS